jgi:hypothetical protein
LPHLHRTKRRNDGANGCSMPLSISAGLLNRSMSTIASALALNRPIASCADYASRRPLAMPPFVFHAGVRTPDCQSLGLPAVASDTGSWPWSPSGQTPALSTI